MARSHSPSRSYDFLEILGGQRYLLHLGAKSALHCVAERRSSSGKGDLPNSFCPERAAVVGVGHEFHVHLRSVQRAWNDMVGHGALLERTIPHFEQFR